MPSVSIRKAQDPCDFEVARLLSREWVDWFWQHYPTDWPSTADHPMHPSNLEAVLRNLESLHAPPKGGILIGSVDGRDEGCAMYHEIEPGIAELKRMFVRETGRGHGLGRLMLEQMFQNLTAAGYKRVFFYSARFLTHARRMYETAGFVEIPHPAQLSEDRRKQVYYMERVLA